MLICMRRRLADCFADIPDINEAEDQLKDLVEDQTQKDWNLIFYNDQN